MNTYSSSLLRDASDAIFYVACRNHHQVVQLVDDNKNVWHALERFLVGVLALQLAAIVRRVETTDVTEAGLNQQVVAALHLLHCPTKRVSSLLWVGYWRSQQMWKAGVLAHLYLLRVDQNEANLVGRGTHEHRRDDAVDCARLTRTGGTCDEHVRGGGNVEKHGAACDVFANGNVERVHCRTRLLRDHEIAERNQFAHSVWYFNANCRLARNWSKNSDVGCGHGVRNVARERRDLGNLYAAA